LNKKKEEMNEESSNVHTNPNRGENREDLKMKEEY